MPSDILVPFQTKALFTITLASLATAAARQSTLISNTGKFPAAIIHLRIKSGAVAPTAGLAYEVYLIRGDDAASSTYRTDNAGATDAAITIENATLLGTIVVTASANKNFYRELDTAHLGPLGVEWGIAVKNASGQALSTTEADHFKGYATYNLQTS